MRPKEEIKYECPVCGYLISFDEAYLVGGKYCPNCDAEVNIPFEFWLYGEEVSG